LNFSFFSLVLGNGHILWFHVLVLQYFFGGFLGCFLEGLMAIDRWFYVGLHQWFLNYLLVVITSGFLCVLVV
jgi:hypothetical protein